ncbi:hypothetical protein EIP91_004791 [Steccherinum ochraceum]|uniref:PH domain-containing protein n=1 Tax=Steccherinum ochraceum TaxID=92696 RepID=A0A4R0R8V6_9APHY|nr:hypothetical protein EIP91_004791 [Steccherinum ochraceum]
MGGVVAVIFRGALPHLTNFLKKVSHLKGGRKKSTSDVSGSSTQDAAAFAVRSMGLGRKSFGYSQPILGVHTNEMPNRRRMSEHDSSSEGGSTGSPRSSNVAHRTSLSRTAVVSPNSSSGSTYTNAGPSPNTNTPSPLTTFTRTQPAPDGLPSSSDEPPWLPTPPPGDPPAAARATSPSAKPNPFDPSRDLLHEPPSRMSSLPSRSGARPPSPSLTRSTSPSATPQMRFARPSDLSREQSLHIRLASLPPPMMARYTAQGSARLTPSLIPRQPPMPILNLPTLPPPTPVLDPPAPRRAPLRSIPALPLTGPRDDENPDMDDEGSCSSEDEEMDDEYMMTRDDMSEEDDGEDSPLPMAPIMSRRRDRDTLPRVDITPFDVPFSFPSTSPAVNANTEPTASGSTQQQQGSRRPASQYWTPSAEVLRTPQLNGQSGPVDYFSSKIRQSDTGIEEVTRTPRPADYTPAVPLVAVSSRVLSPIATSGTSGPGMIPRIVPMPPTPISPALSHRTPRFGAATPAAGADIGRPSLYHHGSRSMVDLISVQKEKEKEEKRSSRVLRPTTGDGPSASGPATTSLTPAPTLRRQRSLPTYRPASLPPPYPEFFHGQLLIIQPREEEGREVLPSYTNDIYLCAMMPRKLEFTAPGVQAKERKWRRVVVELDGTVMRVYRCHGAGSGGKGGKVGEWWERTVGVGDWSSGQAANASTLTGGGVRAAAASGQRERRPAGSSAAETAEPERRRKGEEEEPAEQAIGANARGHHATASKSKLSLVSNLLRPHRSSQESSSSSRLAVPSSASPTRSRMSFDSPRDTERSPSAIGFGRRSVDVLQRSGARSPTSDTGPSRSTSPTTRTTGTSSSSFSTPPTSARSVRSQSRGPSGSHTSTKSSVTAESVQSAMTMVPDSKDMIRDYTLQHAESGLASDYLKRRNVIRVRMEGEQFLLQARDVSGVIEWIENIQAATNISLDLDERPMPKGPMFPRRRRRRARRTDGTPNTNAQSQQADSSRAGASTSGS